MPRREADQGPVRESKRISNIIEEVKSKIVQLEGNCNTEWEEIRIQQLQDTQQRAQAVRRWEQRKIVTG